MYWLEYGWGPFAGYLHSPQECSAIQAGLRGKQSDVGSATLGSQAGLLGQMINITLPPTLPYFHHRAVVCGADMAGSQVLLAENRSVSETGSRHLTSSLGTTPSFPSPISRHPA